MFCPENVHRNQHKGPLLTALLPSMEKRSLHVCPKSFPTSLRGGDSIQDGFHAPQRHYSPNTKGYILTLSIYIYIYIDIAVM